MKINIMIILFLTLTGLCLSSCGATPHVSQISKNQYQIDIQDSIPPNRQNMNAQFIHASRKMCSNPKIITQQYVPNPSGTDHLIGTIECN